MTRVLWGFFETDSTFASLEGFFINYKYSNFEIYFRRVCSVSISSNTLR
jgi:hypothetical protein